MRSMIKIWDDFWFHSDSAFQVRIFRSIFSFILLGFYFTRSFDLDFFYSEAGILQSRVIAEVIPAEYRYSILNIFKSSTYLLIIHTLFLASLGAMCIGFFVRTSNILALALHLSFLHRNMAPVYGVDSIATYYLFYLAIAAFGPAVGGAQVTGRISSYLSSMAFRMMQIQLCVIYAFSGFQKIRGPYWWNGDALWYSLVNSQISRWDFSWIASYAWLMGLLGVATYILLLWEVYFAALVWMKKARYWALGIGIVFHLSTGILLQIPFFGAAMVSIYLLFLNPHELKKLSEVRKKLYLQLKLR